MNIKVERASAVSKSYNSERARGLFNVTEDDGAGFKLEAEIPLEVAGWQVGVVVGTSGSGKTCIGQEIVNWGDFAWWTGGRWPKDKPVIDAFGKRGFDEVTGVLSQVGLGSVPAWLRPYGVLSNGERFRAEMAKLLMTAGVGDGFVLDEFTSVLDRTVAQVGSAAFVRSWRRVADRQVVLLTPHHDILDWVQPDWVFDTDEKRLYQADADETDPKTKGKHPTVGKLVIKR